MSATNITREQTGKYLCRQQCVRINVSSFARASTEVVQVQKWFYTLFVF